MRKKHEKKQLGNKKILCKITIVFLMLMFFSLLLFTGFSAYIYYNAPEFQSELLYRKESSNIYDASGNIIATIGNEKRIIIDYDDLPEVLIDAISSEIKPEIITSKYGSSNIMKINEELEKN